MSIGVIQRYVWPIVLDIFKEEGWVFDEAKIGEFQEFLLNELNSFYSPIGRVGDCEQLEQIIKDIIQKDPVKFRKYLQKLLDKYSKITSSRALEDELFSREILHKFEGPPDRFRKLRKKAQKIWKAV